MKKKPKEIKYIYDFRYKEPPPPTKRINDLPPTIRIYEKVNPNSKED